MMNTGKKTIYCICWMMGCIWPLTGWATEPLVSKSVSFIQGEETTRCFYYDSLNRLTLMEEYGSNGTLIQQTKHTYYGLTDVDSTYRKGRFTHAFATTYTDSTYQYIQKQCLLDKNGEVHNYSENTYDPFNRIIKTVDVENDAVTMVITYTYAPYKCTCIADYAHYDKDVYKIKYMDRLCTKQTLERCITSKDKLVRKNKYDASGRVTEFTEMRKGKITQQIKHLYFNDHEVIIDLDGDVFVNTLR